MAPQTSIKLNYEDYAAIPDDGRRHEIIDGEHYVNPAPNIRHQIISMRLSTALHGFVQAHRLGYVFAAPTDVVLSEHDVVVPDVVFVSNARADLLTEANIQGPPDLVVEILSSSTRRYDTRLKFDMYERTGVGEYWIVDPGDDVVTVFRREGERFRRVDTGDAITTPLLPGFTLPLGAIFET